MEIKVICGTNHFLIEEKIAEINKNHSGEITRLQGSIISKDDLSLSLSSFSMFEDKKIEIIEGFLTRVISEEKTGNWDNLISEIIPYDSPNNIYFIEKFDDENELNSFLKKKLIKDLNSEIDIINIPSGRGGSAKITNWIKSREQDLDLNLSNKQRLYITYESNKDFLLIDNELKKLSDYSQGNSISDYDFNILITFSKNYKIFDLLDMFFAKNNIEVSKILTNLFSSGTKPNEIIGLLNSEIHKVLYIKYLISEGKTNIEISQLSGIKSKYYFGKLFNTAKKIEIKRLLDIQNSLLKFDIKSKSERFNQDLELELMLISK